jgi:hypothetical protein
MSEGPRAAPAAAGHWKVAFVALHLVVCAAFLPWLGRQVVHKTELMGSDFTIFYSGWTLALRDGGRDLYDLGAQRAVQHALMNGVEFPGGVVPFLHPPHAALALAPLALLPRTAATWLWTASELALLAWLAFALARVVGLASRLDRWVLASALLAYPPTFASIQMGQLAILMTVALLGLVLAVSNGADGTAAACLLLLSFKPHLVLAPVAVLVAQRRWGVLGRAALGGAVAAGAATLVFGRHVWVSYLAALPSLERFWGKGGPEFMVDFRGAVVRLAGGDGTSAVALLTYGALAASTLAIYGLARRRVVRGAPAAEVWPAALALGLLFNPHLFLHDALLWVVPLALFVAQRRGQGRAMAFTAFALSWPLVCLVNETIERNDHLLPVHLLFVEAVAATVWMVAAELAVPATSPERAVT